MTKLDLTREQITIEAALQLAKSGSVRIISAEGRAFLLEEADNNEGGTGLDRKALRELARKSPPPQGWFDGEETKPF